MLPLSVMADRNIPGRAGPKGNKPGGGDDVPAVLVEDVMLKYRQARTRVELYAARVDKRGATTTNVRGDVVPSAYQKNLEAAQSHYRAMAKLYKDVVGAAPEEADGELVVLDFAKEKSG